MSFIVIKTTVRGHCTMNTFREMATEGEWSESRDPIVIRYILNKNGTFRMS
jgi:hypothetical protein